ncbi:hypothetical protein Ciccas_014199 [Cichlidogyrus casuarinus]|uniref:Uncharacterized protein n=1 Tax=Cichlidogyrus casuarinus TaxID=1844966 RepID=A0ABD2PIQ7_9PLAT
MRVSLNGAARIGWQHRRQRRLVRSREICSQQETEKKMPIVDSLRGFLRGLEQDMGRGLENIRASLRSDSQASPEHQLAHSSSDQDQDHDEQYHLCSSTSELHQR